MDKKDFLIYTSADGEANVQVLIDNERETIWATQKGMAELFGVETNTINYHIKTIFASEELQEESVVRKIRITASDGKGYLTQLYNLDVIIAVGYRVNSVRATQFRIWATSVLREYLVKGFALDDERMKRGGKLFGKDYFDELLERIREIRASERMFYEKITDIFMECSTDYDKNSPITRKFYAAMQNKFHFAIHQHTAAEIIYGRADARKRHMGLTSWKNQPKGGKIYKSDVGRAKNYLKEEELKALNRLVNMFLDHAERLAEKGKGTYTMEDWVNRFEMFLKFNEYPILSDAGKVKMEVAKRFAESEYDKFRKIQDLEFQSDFNKLIAESKENAT